MNFTQTGRVVLQLLAARSQKDMDTGGLALRLSLAWTAVPGDGVLYIEDQQQGP